jgi:uncharacterized protein
MPAHKNFQWGGRTGPGHSQAGFLKPASAKIIDFHEEDRGNAVAREPAIKPAGQGWWRNSSAGDIKDPLKLDIQSSFWNTPNHEKYCRIPFVLLDSSSCHNGNMRTVIYFTSDGLRLCGTLHLPEAEKPPVIIGSHGFFSTGDSPKQIDLAEKCAANNMGFFRFDHRGCGKSEGNFAGVTTFDGRCRDLAAAIDLMLSRSDTGNDIALFGSSFGGAVVLKTAAEREVRAVVTVAAPIRLDAIHPPDISSPEEAFRLHGLEKERLDFDITDQLGLVSNLLSFHGDRDAVVPFSNALAIHEKAGHPKILIRQESGDHPMSDPGHQQDFLLRSVSWYREKLGLSG